MAAVDVVQVLGLKFFAGARADARLEVGPLKSLRSSCDNTRAPFKRLTAQLRPPKPPSVPGFSV